MEKEDIQHYTEKLNKVTDILASLTPNPHMDGSILTAIREVADVKSFLYSLQN